MQTARQSFYNRTETPIYVSIELTPDCYELEPGDHLTLLYEPLADRDGLQVDFLNERELVIWPNGRDPEVLFNDEPAKNRSGVFKHR